MRQGRCCHNRRIFNAHPVMNFVALLQPAKNGNRVFNIWLAYINDLEAALKRRVFLNVLAIFVQSGSADGA